MEKIKQYIILRKDAKTVNGELVSPEKIAVMVSHASMAFLSKKILNNTINNHTSFDLDTETYEWLLGIFTKILLSAKSLNEMNKIIQKATDAGLKENIDFFTIKDNCLTELVPDDGDTRCFIAIGFKPMNVDKIKPIVKRLQLYSNNHS